MSKYRLRVHIRVMNRGQWDVLNELNFSDEVQDLIGDVSSYIDGRSLIIDKTVSYNGFLFINPFYEITDVIKYNVGDCLAIGDYVEQGGRGASAYICEIGDLSESETSVSAKMAATSINDIEAWVKSREKATPKSAISIIKAFYGAEPQPAMYGPWSIEKEIELRHNVFLKATFEEIVEIAKANISRVETMFGGDEKQFKYAMLTIIIEAGKLGITDGRKANNAEKNLLKSLISGISEGAIAEFVSGLESSFNDKDIEIIDKSLEVAPQFASSFLDMVFCFMYADGKATEADKQNLKKISATLSMPMSIAYVAMQFGENMPNPPVNYAAYVSGVDNNTVAYMAGSDGVMNVNFGGENTGIRMVSADLSETGNTVTVHGKDINDAADKFIEECTDELEQLNDSWQDYCKDFQNSIDGIIFDNEYEVRALIMQMGQAQREYANEYEKLFAKIDQVGEQLVDRGISQHQIRRISYLLNDVLQGIEDLSLDYDTYGKSHGQYASGKVTPSRDMQDTALAWEYKKKAVNSAPTKEGYKQKSSVKSNGSKPSIDWDDDPNDTDWLSVHSSMQEDSPAQKAAEKAKYGLTDDIDVEIIKALNRGAKTDSEIKKESELLKKTDSAILVFHINNLLKEGRIVSENIKGTRYYAVSAEMFKVREQADYQEKYEKAKWNLEHCKTSRDIEAVEKTLSVLEESINVFELKKICEEKKLLFVEYEEWHKIYIEVSKTTEEKVTKNINLTQRSIDKACEELKNLEALPLRSQELLDEKEVLRNAICEKEKEIEELQKSGANMSEELQTLGVFKFSEKKKLKEKIAENDAAIEKCENSLSELKSKIAAIEKTLAAQFEPEQKASLISKKQCEIDELHKTLELNRKTLEKFSRYNVLLTKLLSPDIFKQLRVDKDKYLTLTKALLKIDSVTVGDTIFFGHYPSEDEKSNKPIEWEVLSKDSKEILIVTKYVVDCQAYNNYGKAYSWEESSLYEWLYGEFYDKAFNACEKSILSGSTSGCLGNNSLSGAEMSCLSIEEANKYYQSDAERRCTPTRYAEKRGVRMEGSYCMWWLCTPFDDSAFYVEPDGSTAENWQDYRCCGVRPTVKIVL